MHDLALIQYVKFLGAASGHFPEAIANAHKYYGPHADLTELLTKQSMGTSDLGADDGFVTAGNKFLPAVSRRSVLGKIDAISRFRRAPANTPMLIQNGRPTAYWTAEKAVTRASKTSFETEQIARRKISCLIVCTNQLLQGQGPAFEDALKVDLAVPIAEMESFTLLDPDHAGVAVESPASLTYGLTPLESTGNPRADIELLVESFQGDLSTAVLVMGQKQAVAAGKHFNDLVGARGGEAGGIPVVTSASVQSDSSGTYLALIDPSGILLLDDGIDFRISQSATIQISDDPADGYYSLFQNDLTGIIATRFLNWKIARDGSVSMMNIAWETQD